MSYKHNDLMAMRHNYWNDVDSVHVQQEKYFLQTLLIKNKIFPEATLDDAKYLFFSLPSFIIIRGYASGFASQSVQQLICDYIQTHQQQLRQRIALKIQFKI